MQYRLHTLLIVLALGPVLIWAIVRFPAMCEAFWDALFTLFPPDIGPPS